MRACYRDDGDIPLRALLSRLDDAGCTPTVGLEIFSLALNRRDPEEVARAG